MTDRGFMQSATDAAPRRPGRPRGCPVAPVQLGGHDVAWAPDGSRPDMGKSDARTSRDRSAHRFGRDFWNERWPQVLREPSHQIAERQPNGYLMAAVDRIGPGRALDAGCGHGAEARWLAAQGWQVTAVDLSAVVLAHARSMAEALGPGIAERIDWMEGDLAIWTPQPGCYDLVSSLYVHVASSVEEMVSRLATGVAPGGTLLLVGHLPVDPVTGAETPAAGQVQVTVEAATAALDPCHWEMFVAEERPRAIAGTGFDAVICARRRT